MAEANNYGDLVNEAVDIINDPERLVRVVMSGATRGVTPAAVRIDLKPVAIKSEIRLQVISNDGRVATTKNYVFGELDITELITSGFSNILVEHLDGSMTLKIPTPGQAKVSREKTKKTQNLSHDKSKSRLLSPTDPIFVELGISDAQGNVKPSRMDKYKQVEEFLRILQPTLSSALSAQHIRAPTSESPLKVVDLGCGHAYLTFAAHQFLQAQKYPTQLVGIDVREDSRDRNTAIAAKIGISSSISFRAETIAATDVADVDIAIALHACDTATDDAIAWAIKANAKILLIAPCCHHDIQKQLDEIPEPWSIVTKHGVMRERLADLLTDGFRAQLIKMAGYRVDVIEFIGGEHTPRTMMIRAVKTGAARDQDDVSRYEAMKAQWKVTPALEGLLNS